MNFKLAFLLLTIITITACGGSDSIDKVNIPPIANAGTSQSMTERSEINLSGAGTDEDGSINSYYWSQVEGKTAVIENAGRAIATIIAPSVDIEETLTFELTVTDSEGATASDTVDIIVTPILLMANAGEDRTYFHYEKFSLDCNQSEDEIADLRYLWTQISGSNITLNDATLCSPSGQLTNSNETYVFELQIFNVFDFGTDTVNIVSKEYTGKRYEDRRAGLPTLSFDTSYNELRQLNNKYSFKSLTYDGSYLYAISNNQLLVIEDNGAVATEISTFYSEEHLSSVVFKNNHLFIANDRGFDVIDSSNPLSLQLVAEYHLDSDQYATTRYRDESFLVSEQYAYLPFSYIACEGCEGEANGYQMVDISTADTPKFSDSILTYDLGPNRINLANSTNDIYYFWNPCILLDGTPNGVSEWNPDSMLCEEFTDTESPADSMLVQGNSIYTINSNSDELRVYDVHDKNITISQLKLYESVFPKFTFINQEELVVVTDGGGDKKYDINIFDIKNPLEPKIKGIYGINNDLKDLMLVGDTIYLIEDNSGTLSAIETQAQSIKQTSANLAEIKVNDTVIIDYQYTNFSETRGDCLVTSGDCRVEFNNENSTIRLVWRPSELGEHEILLFIGNKNYTISSRERVLVTTP